MREASVVKRHHELELDMQVFVDRSIGLQGRENVLELGRKEEVEEKEKEEEEMRQTAGSLHPPPLRNKLLLPANTQPRPLITSHLTLQITTPRLASFCCAVSGMPPLTSLTTLTSQLTSSTTVDRARNAEANHQSATTSASPKQLRLLVSGVEEVSALCVMVMIGRWMTG
jgi:hypothetical protein